MRKIGITGGVGAGKSKVLAYLKTKPGTRVYQADKIAYDLQQPGQNCYHQMIEYFGLEIVGEDGSINRKLLGSIVFTDEEKLLKLNQIVHPAVNERIEELMAMEEKNGTQNFILEAALLTEPYYRTILDEIWYIYTEESIRKIRLKESRNYSDEKTNSIIKSQPGEEQFRAAANVIVQNSGEFCDTAKQIDDLLDR